MDKLSYAILDVLLNNDCKTRLRSMTVKDLEEQVNIKGITIYKKISKLQSFGYVADGIKDGRANTYYITQLGVDKLQEELV